MNDAESNVRGRRLALVLMLVAAVSIVGTVAVLSARSDDPLAGERSPAPSTVTPVARVTLLPTSRAPRRARGLAEIVKRDDRHELRLIAQHLPRTREDEVYRIYFARGDAEQTLGKSRTDRRGTLLGESPVDASDLTEFSTLRVALESSAGSRAILNGKLPR